MLCVAVKSGKAQQTPSPADEHTAPGKLISAGKNSTPVGPLKAKTYRLEQVQLEKPFDTIEADGTKHRLETAIRLKVTLGSPPTNDYFIWIDDVPELAYPSGHEKLTGENSISLLLLTPMVPFENGSSLAISRDAGRLSGLLLALRLDFQL